MYDISVPRYNNFILGNGLVVHNCKPYQALKSAIYEERLEIYDSELLTEELLGLERDNNGRIEHPLGGTAGSKDSADALCGSLWNASQHAEEYAFEYGEDLELVTKVSTGPSSYDMKQIEVDMEEALKALHDPVQNKLDKNPQKSPFMDFGMGKATDQFSYLNSGIIVF